MPEPGGRVVRVAGPWLDSNFFCFFKGLNDCVAGGPIVPVFVCGPLTCFLVSPCSTIDLAKNEWWKYRRVTKMA